MEAYIKKYSLYKRGDKIYIDCNVLGSRIRFSTGVLWSKDNCRKILKNASNIIYQKIRGESKSTFLKDICAEILEVCRERKNKNSTLENVKKWLNILESNFGNKDLRLLNNKNILDFLNKKCTHYSRSSLRVLVGVINRIISIGNSRGAQIERVDFRSLRLGKEPAKIEPFTLGEIKKILQSADEDFYLFLCVAFFTGARTGEILGLKWSDIDLKNNKIIIERTITPKNKEQSPKTNTSRRVIDMLPIIKDALKNRVKNTNYIFNKNNAPLRFHEVRQKWYALLDSLDLKRQRLYITRHTFASIMIQQGEEQMWVSKMLGHSSLKITLDFYARFIPDESKKRAEFLNDFFNKKNANFLKNEDEIKNKIMPKIQKEVSLETLLSIKKKG